MPLEGPSNSMRPGKGFGVLRPKRTTGSTLMCARNFQLAQVLDVGLKIIRLEDAANLIDFHLQRMLRDGDAQNSRRRQRGELRSLARRDLPRARREYESDGVDVGIRRRADRIRTGDAAYLDPHGAECSHLGFTVRVVANISAGAALRIIAAHQRRADQRQPIPQAPHARGIGALMRRRSRPRPANLPASSGASSCESLRHDFQRLQVAAIDADQDVILVDCRDRAGARGPVCLARDAKSSGVERLEQHEQADARPPHRAAPAVCARDSIRTISSTPPAPAARASSTW